MSDTSNEYDLKLPSQGAAPINHVLLADRLVVSLALLSNGFHTYPT